MSVETSFEQLFKKIDELKPRFIERLAKAIEIPAVSSDESLRPQVVKKAHFIAGELKKLGFSDIQMKELGTQPVSYTHLDVYKRQLLMRALPKKILCIQHFMLK